MDALSQGIDWLFGTRGGVGVLMVGGIVLFLIIAFVLERRGKKQYYNHELKEGEEKGLLEDLFDDSDD